VNLLTPEPEVTTMKGYSETRGQVFKLEFDTETKQFITRPIVHDVMLQAEIKGSTQNISAAVKAPRVRKKRRSVAKSVAPSGRDMRDDDCTTTASSVSQ
jgi:hypothetical protein